MDETSTENERPSAAANIADGWQRFEEPLWKTLVRNVGIAAAVGAVLALSRRRLSSVGLFTLLALWFTLGGHYVEVMFLNVVRGQWPKRRSTQVIARLAVWFVGGCVLFLGMSITARLLSIHSLDHRALWIGGGLLIGIELVVHLLGLFRRRPNFYEAARG